MTTRSAKKPEREEPKTAAGEEGNQGLDDGISVHVQAQIEPRKEVDGRDELFKSEFQNMKLQMEALKCNCNPFNRGNR